MKQAYILEPHELERIIQEIRTQITNEVSAALQNSIVEKPLRQDEACKFLGISVKHICRLRQLGLIKEHRFTDGGAPYYFPSEMVVQLKSKRGKRKS